MNNQNSKEENTTHINFSPTGGKLPPIEKKDKDRIKQLKGGISCT